MSTRSGSVALLALALLGAALLLPLASADHAYSHRYIVFGRVVDANGNPVPGEQVDLGYEAPFEPEGPCDRQPLTETAAKGETRNQPITNQFGEFIFCFHTHSMSRSLPGVITLAAESRNVTERVELDPYFRHSYVVLNLPDARPNADGADLARNHTIEGTVWRPGSGETFLENIRVFGLTADRAPVNITFEYNGKPAQTYNTTTNNYGDFAIRVPITEKVTSGKITVEVGGETRTFDASPEYGVSSLKVELEKKSDPFVRNFLIGLGVVVGIVAVGAGAYVATGKVRAGREERLARERSTRKRANK